MEEVTTPTPTVTDAEVERVARAICNADGGTPDACPLGRPNWKLYEREARAAISAMTRSDDGLRSALEPFAKAADNYSDGVPDTGHLIYGEVTVGDCRKARSTLTKGIDHAEG